MCSGATELMLEIAYVHYYQTLLKSIIKFLSCVN